MIWFQLLIITWEITIVKENLKLVISLSFINLCTVK